MASHGETRKRALREAKSLLQLYGYHGFSYQDLADALGIKKPSLYEHFASKEDLAICLIEDYRAAFEAWIETIEAMDPRTKIHAFFEIVLRFAKDGAKYCPLSILTAELHSLPEALRASMQAMLRVQSRWLEATIAEGQKTGSFRQDLGKKALSDTLMAMLIGSQFLARLHDAKKISSVREQALNFLQNLSNLP